MDLDQIIQRLDVELGEGEDVSEGLAGFVDPDQPTLGARIGTVFPRSDCITEECDQPSRVIRPGSHYLSGMAAAAAPGHWTAKGGALASPP